MSARLVALAAALASAAAPAAAQAQALRTLHVSALSMRADRERVPIGTVFHLAIHVRVRENVAALDELVIPDVGTMQLLGDERSVTHGGGGTDAVETLTLQPSHSGAFTFRPAYLDAIDANTGKPSRFSSNAVRVEILPTAGAHPPPRYGALAERAVELVLLVLAAIALVLGFRAFVRLRRARARSEAHAAPPFVAPAPEPVPARTPREEVADALRTYRTAPAGPALRRLRAALFTAAGTNGGSTLGDALGGTSDHALRLALIAAERAAFGPPHERDGASSELVTAAEAWLR